MVKDEKLAAAVSRILQRSEKSDQDRLLETFVDVGILPQLHNNNSQIVYGRRGTGKTHVFSVLQSRLSEDSRNTVVYIDARTLGSSAQFSDTSLPLKNRCLALFRDVFIEIHNGLLEHIINNPPTHADRALGALDELYSIVADPVQSVQTDIVSTKMTTHTNRAENAGVEFSFPTAAKASAGSTTSRALGSEVAASYSVASEDKVMFPALNKAVANVLELADTHLYLLIDEWSSLPADIQPYLAEFLKKSILPNARAVLKIASLEYRSHFGVRQGSQIMGFEVGSDVATAPDLDDYYVFDRNRDSVSDAFADMLLRHISTELPDNYLKNTYKIESGRDLQSRLFTERDTFVELVRSSEGVVRDLINIFTKAYFHAHKRDRDSIDRRAITEAARQWFEQDKAKNLDDDLQTVLRRIVDQVIGEKKARSFLLPRQLERHPIVQRLIDARVLHHVQRGFADKNNPGVRYNIYALDYGTYVDLMGTSKQPEMGFTEEHLEEEGFIVPFDDKRSIRQIVLTEDILRT